MENSAQIILGLVFWGIIVFWFISRKKGWDKKSMSDILKNDPVLNKLDKDIAELNNRSGQLSPEAKRIFIRYGGTWKEKEDLFQEEKLIQINKIEEYLELGYIDFSEKENYLDKFITNSNPLGWFELSEKLDDSLQKDKRRFELAKIYGKDIAQRLVWGQVWLNMTSSELITSRGTPNDKEKELTKGGEIEIFIYGNKKTGSYFTLQNDKVIKIKDRT
jgi:hypothetical protein